MNNKFMVTLENGDMKEANQVTRMTIYNNHYLVYSIKGEEDYNLYVSKIIKFNNMDDLIDVADGEKDLVFKIIRTIMKITDNKELSLFLNENKVTLI